MNKSVVGISLLALILNAPSLAADCLLPASALLNQSLSLVAPEMLRPVVVDPYCVGAQDALARIRAQTAALAAGASGAYVPLTKDDNTPWRFDMSQNGKRMTLMEFDGWMKAKGIRVATGKPSASAPDGSQQPAAKTGQ